MPPFVVQKSEIWTRSVTVNATTPEEALLKAQDDVNTIESSEPQYVRDYEPASWHVGGQAGLGAFGIEVVEPEEPEEEVENAEDREEEELPELA